MTPLDNVALSDWLALIGYSHPLRTSLLGGTSAAFFFMFSVSHSDRFNLSEKSAEQNLVV